MSGGMIRRDDTYRQPGISCVVPAGTEAAAQLAGSAVWGACRLLGTL